MTMYNNHMYNNHSNRYTIINDEVVPEAIFSPEECGFDTVNTHTYIYLYTYTCISLYKIILKQNL